MNKLRFEEKIKPLWDENTTEQIKSALQKKYLAFLNNEEFEVESGINKAQIQLKTTLRSKDGSVAYPVECVHIVEPSSELTSAEIGELLLDYLDVYWNEYLTLGRDVFIPLDWSKHECEGVEFYMRGFVRNIELESKADEILDQHGSGAFNIEPISSET